MLDGVIIGGGPAGAALALLAARAGRDVALIERDAIPRDKVCGEFISYEAQAYLTELDIDLVGLGAVPLNYLRISHKHRSSQIRLPFQGLSLSRKILDATLLDKAQAQGAKLHLGRNARSLGADLKNWNAAVGSSQYVTAKAAFLATGKHEMTGWPRRFALHGDLVAFKLFLQRTEMAPDIITPEVELVLFPDGYAGIQPVEAGRINLCLLISQHRLRRIGKNWTKLQEWLGNIAPRLGALFAGTRMIAARPLAISNIPYGYFAPPAPPGLWRLGDQAAVIPSFAGDGISIALHSAFRAAEHFLAGRSTEIYRQDLARDIKTRVRGATLLSKLMVVPALQSALIMLGTAQPKLVEWIIAATRVPVAVL